MGVEREILELLKRGLKPKEIIEMGYKKSTVYKVYQKFKAVSHKLPFSWKIEDVKISPKDRFLPGEYLRISGYFRNTSDRDFYLYRIGIQPEWLIKEEKWIAHEVREVIRPGGRKFVSFGIKIPEDIPLGEYELRFGVEGQYLMTGEPPKFSWAEPPVILDVKYPVWLKMFISHSTRDLSLIRLLERSFDNYGVQVTIAGDLRDWDEITREIRKADVVLVILTDITRFERVKREIEYTRQIGKPILPLKEESVNVQVQIDNWIVFSKNEDPEKIFRDIMEHLRNINYRHSRLDLNLIGILGSLIMSFIFGYLFANLAGGRKT